MQAQRQAARPSPPRLMPTRTRHCLLLMRSYLSRVQGILRVATARRALTETARGGYHPGSGSGGRSPRSREPVRKVMPMADAPPVMEVRTFYEEGTPGGRHWQADLLEIPKRTTPQLNSEVLAALIRRHLEWVVRDTPRRAVGCSVVLLPEDEAKLTEEIAYHEATGRIMPRARRQNTVNPRIHITGSPPELRTSVLDKKVWLPRALSHAARGTARVVHSLPTGVLAAALRTFSLPLRRTTRPQLMSTSSYGTGSSLIKRTARKPSVKNLSPA